MTATPPFAGGRDAPTLDGQGWLPEAELILGAVMNIGAADALLIKAASQPYDHSRRDHWRRAPRSGEIPVEP